MAEQKTYEVTKEFTVKFDETVRVKRIVAYDNKETGLQDVYVGHKARSKGETVAKGEKVYLSEAQAEFYKANVKGEAS